MKGIFTKVVLTTGLLLTSLPYSGVNADSNDQTLDFSDKSIQAELKQAEKDTKEARERVADPKELAKNYEKYKKSNPEKFGGVSIYTAGEMGTVGDILVSYDSAHFGWNHGHAAIVRYNNDYIVEAWTGNTDAVRIYQNNWANRWDSKKKFYVYSASHSDYVDSDIYAGSKTGKPYSIMASKTSTSSYYCSQLLWQAWNYAGWDLDGNGGSIVTPADLENDSSTIQY